MHLRRGDLLAGLLGLSAALLATALFAKLEPSALSGDAVLYDQAGWSLVRGRGFVMPTGEPITARPPGYPAFIAGIYAVAGHAPRAVAGVQALLHAATVLLFAGIARRMFPGQAAVARIAPWAIALYPFLLHASTRLLTESATTFLLALALFWMIRGPARIGSWALAAVPLAAASHLHASLVAYPAFLVGLLLATRGRIAPLHCGLALLAVSSVLVLPWSLRTSRLLETPAALAASGLGHSLHIGTWEYRELGQIFGPQDFHIQEPPGFHRNEAEAHAELAFEIGDPRRRAEVDRARFAQAFDEIRAHPGLYLRATLIRSVTLWVHQFLPRLPRWLKPGVAGLCLLLLALAVLGVLRQWPLSPSAWLVLTPALYLVLLHAPLHVEARYTLPARPGGILFALAGAAWLLEAARRRGGLKRRSSA